MDLSNTDPMLMDLLSRKEEILKKIKAVKKRLNTAPNGSLRVAKKHRNYQYYQVDTKNDTLGKYIHSKDRSIAIRLAQKDYDTKLLKVLEKQQKAIDRFLKTYDPDEAHMVYGRLTDPRRQLVTPEYLSDEEFIRRWENEPYHKLGFGTNDPEFYTARGERVRSKSEILIADALYRNNIPYRYEFPVYHNGVIMAAPDFNCLNVRLRKEYYWEHLGKLGDEEYADRNVKKIEKYTLADDFDESRLILTMETDNKPLDTRVVEEKIRRYLL